MRRFMVLLSAIVMLLAACSSDDETPEATTTTARAPGAAETTTTSSGAADREIRVLVVEGEVVGGSQRVSLSVGERVRLEVTADVADDVHVHGYDRFVAIAPPDPAVLVFDADIPGVFEVELEDAGLTLVELEVS